MVHGENQSPFGGRCFCGDPSTGIGEGCLLSIAKRKTMTNFIGDRSAAGATDSKRIRQSGTVIWIAAVVSVFAVQACNSRSSYPDMSYRRSTRDLYDAAELIDSRQFSTKALSQRLKQFAAGECKGRRLARLVVAPDRRDLANAVNLDLPEGAAVGLLSAQGNQLLNPDLGTPKVAQAL